MTILLVIDLLTSVISSVKVVSEVLNKSGVCIIITQCSSFIRKFEFRVIVPKSDRSLSFASLGSSLNQFLLILGIKLLLNLQLVVHHLFLGLQNEGFFVHFNLFAVQFARNSILHAQI